jgi:hypothetical protein
MQIMTREKMFNKIWSAEHPDYRGKRPCGKKSILSHMKFGSGIVSAETISDAELTERFNELQKRKNQPYYDDAAPESI